MKKLLSFLCLSLLAGGSMLAGTISVNGCNGESVSFCGVEQVNDVAETQSRECPLNVCSFVSYTKAQITAILGSRNITKDGSMWIYDNPGYLNVGDDGQFDYYGFYMKFNSKGRLSEVGFMCAENTESEANEKSDDAIGRFRINRSYIEKSDAFYQKNGRGKVNVFGSSLRDGKYTWGILFKYLK